MLWVNTILNGTKHLRQYGLAIGSVMVAFLLMLLLDPVLQLTKTYFLLFFGAVTISALYGGRNAGITATLFSAVLASYFFLTPQQLSASTLADSLRLSLYILQGIVLSILIGSLRQTQAQARKNLIQIKATEVEINALNQALQRRVDELQTVLNAIPINVVITEDPDCQVVKANSTYSTLLHLPPDTNVSSVSSYDRSQLPYRFYQNGRELAANELPLEYAVRHGVELHGVELDLVQPDNTVVSLYGNAVPLFNEAGQPRGGIAAYIDISDRKRREINATFLAEIAIEFSYLSTVEDIIQAVGVKLNSYFNVSSCHFVDIDVATEQAIVAENWRTPDVPDIRGTYRLSQFLTPEVYRILQAGEAIVVGDTQNDARVNAAAFAAIGVLGFITVPFHRFGEWRYLLSITTSQTRHWFKEEIELIQELASRIFPRLERARAEAALQHSEEQLRLATEAANLGMWYWDVTTDTLIWTDQAKAMFGLPIETEMSMQVFLAAVHPDDRPSIQTIVTDLQVAPIHTESEYRTRWADGTVRWILARGDSTYDASGRLISTRGVLMDITDRKQVEESLRENENRFRTLADNISQFAWMADEQGWIFWYNQQWFHYTGTTLEQMQGWGWQAVHHPDYVEQVVTKFRQYIESGEAWEDTFPIRGKDGHYRWFLSRAIPMRDHQGTVYRWFGTNTDITDLRETELALRQTTERLNIALKSAPITLFNQDLDLRYTWVYNPTHDYSANEMIGKRDQELVSPDTAINLTQLKQQVIDTGVGLRKEVKATRSNQTYYYDLTIDPIQDSDLEIVGIAGAAVDITERKQIEAVLAANEARLRGFVDSNVIGITYGNIDGTIYEANDALLQLIGYTQADLQAGRLRWIDITPADQLYLDQRAIAEAKLNGACTPYEKEYICKDGGRVPILIGFSLLGAAREESVAFILDLSDRKQAEEALRHSEERYRCLAELIPQLVWTANGSGMLLDVNQRWLDYSGLTLEQIATLNWEDIIHPEDTLTLAQCWSAAVAQGTPYQAEGRMRRADGTYCWHLHQAIPQKDEHNQILKWFGTATNIEIQKQLEVDRDRLLHQEQAAREAAERANRIKDEFLAVLSHELRSPLNPILGWTRLLQTRQFNPAKTAEALAIIERNAKLQTQLIDDLLDIAKILRGKFTINVAPVDLVCVIEAAIDTIKTAATAKNIRLHLALTHVGFVSGDAARLQQIVWNLLSNAIKFTPNGGQVKIYLEQVTDKNENNAVDRNGNGLSSFPAFAQITVSDTGKGISPDFLPYIFESFRQEDASITRHYGGLGLGLSIVKYLVDAHGGTIAASSGGEGRGATFIVKIPLLKQELSIPTAHPSSSSDFNLAGIKVLAVDDSEDARHLLTALLTYYDAEVKVVQSGAEILTLLDSFKPDVLICDISMPDMDGYTLLQHIRSLSSEHRGDIPAIAVTAYAREQDHQQALAYGFQRHITKPLDAEMLAIAVAELARRSSIQSSGRLS